MHHDADRSIDRSESRTADTGHGFPGPPQRRLDDELWPARFRTNRRQRCSGLDRSSVHPGHVATKLGDTALPKKLAHRVGLTPDKPFHPIGHYHELLGPVNCDLLTGRYSARPRWKDKVLRIDLHSGVSKSALNRSVSRRETYDLAVDRDA